MLSEEKKFLTGCSEHVPVSVLSNRAKSNRNGCSVLFLHGFKGFASWGFFKPLSSFLCNQGFDVYRMNFSMNGLSITEDSEISRPEEFRKNSFSAEVEEATRVCSFVRQHSGNHELILLGHSRGGGIALLCASEPELNIRGVIALAPVSDFGVMLNPFQPDNWKTSGFAQVLNGRNGALLPMDYALYEDARKPENHVLSRISQLTCPVCLIHGDADESVPIGHSISISEAAVEAHLYIMPGVGHTFGILHPYSSAEVSQQEFLNELSRQVDKAVKTIRSSA